MGYDLMRWPWVAGTTKLNFRTASRCTGQSRQIFSYKVLWYRRKQNHPVMVRVCDNIFEPAPDPKSSQLCQVANLESQKKTIVEYDVLRFPHPRGVQKSEALLGSTNRLYYNSELSIFLFF